MESKDNAPGLESKSQSDVRGAQHKDHINNVYRVVFEKLDSEDVRGARHFVYEMDKVDDGRGNLVEKQPEDLSDLQFKTENWLKLDTPALAGAQEWRDHKAKAEKIARSLDQFGFLIREGIVPINILARFFTYPTLRCWYKLCPYIHEVRKQRNQKGHMWEWENLVRMVIVKSLDGQGVWKGSRHHDNLDSIIDQISRRTKALNILTDEGWLPPDRSWADE